MCTYFFLVLRSYFHVIVVVITAAAVMLMLVGLVLVEMLCSSSTRHAIEYNIRIETVLSATFLFNTLLILEN